MVLVFVVLLPVPIFWSKGATNVFLNGQADLRPFFNFHPWLYQFLVPAIAMRLWAEERKSGTVELLMTLPVTPWQAVLGKFADLPRHFAPRRNLGQDDHGKQCQ